MYVTNRCLSALAAIAVAIVGLAACGGNSSNEIVAQVAGVGSISKAALDHWIPVEAVVLYQEDPTKPIPRGVIPDPPDYTACIAYLRSPPAKLVEHGPKPTTAQLKSKCQYRYEELKELTLNTLIGWDWLIGAGMKLGIKASEAEVGHWLTEVNERTFPQGQAELTTYLKLTRQTGADMLFRAKVQVFEVKLVHKKEAMEKLLPRSLTAQQRQSALARFTEYLPPGKQWAATTSCTKGYVVSACKQYKGSSPPGIPN